jgi:adenylate kinase family enzyme
MDEKIQFIKEWLGTGSINIFGLPFSGKDTVGIRLAEDLGAKFLSSGMILRAAADVDMELKRDMASGVLVPQEKFREIVLRYIGRDDLREYPLILSSVGRWYGEEQDVVINCKRANHDIKAVILLNVSETVAKERWAAAQQVNDRGMREDDKIENVLETRIEEFMEKTMPVVEYYQNENLLVSIQANQDREAVYASVINQLYEFARPYRVIIEGNDN